ncbi:RAD55 family ATPase [Methanosalsum natronophilum]|nr:ATPase domain-containing protein [Methanosalsum natronophilum]MCS3922983.1 KaiC/GvpD/RAD55 family RecA-like ATPase [Methanosalsum natronophilum]
MNVERIPTGITGLDRVIEGGVLDNTTLLVVGSSGTGKSTFSMQYIMYGLERGENALYISLEEPPEQIMREAKMLGFDMDEYYENELFFFHSKGEDFRNLVEEQLPSLVEASQELDVNTRVVIDPLTPMIWSVKDKQEQRELITKLFYTLKQIGPVLVTTEEHASPGETMGEDVLIPVYLSDGAVHLTYRPIGGAFNRALEIIKMRATRHGEEVYPYIFVRGLGVVVRTTPMVSAEDINKYDDVFDKAIKTATELGAPRSLQDKLKKIKQGWSYSFSPKETLQLMFEMHDLTGTAPKARNDTEVDSSISEDNTEYKDTKSEEDVTTDNRTDSTEMESDSLIDMEDLSELEEIVN